MVGTKRHIVRPPIRAHHRRSLPSEVEPLKRTPLGSYVVEMTRAQALRLAQTHPELWVEEDQPLELFGIPGLPPRIDAEGQFRREVLVRDQRTGQPVPGVSVYGIGQGLAHRCKTSSEGRTVLATRERSVSEVVVSPRFGYWSRLLHDVDMGEQDELQVTLQPLPVTGDYSWGHRFMGFDRVNQHWTGRGIRVGIIDTGISSAEADVRPEGGLNTISDTEPERWDEDEKGHGTHCAGIVASLHNDFGVRGGAPDARIYSLKVYPGGRLSDLLEAVEWCVHAGLDVVSMSLGSKSPSRALSSAIEWGVMRGTTFVAAVGNHASHVSFPAANPWTIAVGAFGRHGTFPINSAHRRQVGHAHDPWGRLFGARFTNYGPALEVCAPGVAIVSTVPGGYAAWDGTSMACPLISALVALILEANPSIRTGDWRQVAWVRDMLQRSSVDLGLSPLLQGSGVPLANWALPEAHRQSRRVVVYPFA